MLHRALFGSIERFFGVLLEHYAGAFPTWLAPVQVTVIPISDRHIDYAQQVRKQLEARDVRVDVYAENEPMRIKIAKAQQQKVPYMLVVGDKEAESGQVGVRERAAGDLGARTIDELVAMVKEGDPLAS